MSSGDKFKIVPQGYDVYEVNKFLKVVTAEFEKIVKRNTELEQKVSSLNKLISDKNSEVSSIDKVKLELDTFVEQRKQVKTNLENEISILEERVDDYNKLLNKLYYDHIEVINKLKD